MTSLEQAGNQVTVLTGLGDYATGHIPKRYRWWRHRNEEYHHVSVHRVRTISRRTGPIFRSLNYLSFAINGWFWGKFQKKPFDLVYVYLLSPVTMGYPAIAVANKQKIPLLFYNLDLWPESVKAMHIEENTLPFKIIHRLSKRIYSRADQIAVTSLPFIDYLHDVNDIDKNKIRYIPQYADTAPEVTSNGALSKLLEEKKAKNNFVFTGNIGFAQDVETIIKAIALLRDEGIASSYLRIHLVGDGSNLDSLKKLTNRLNLADYVVFYGRRPGSEMPAFYQFADACLLTLNNKNKIGVTIPAKLQGYMAAKKPIIAAIDGDAERVIAEAECGIRVPSGDFEQLARAFKNFLHLSVIQKQRLAENGFQYFLANFTKRDFLNATQEWLLENTKKEIGTNAK